MKKAYPILLFILLITGISFYYNYQEIAFKRPQSVHKWRQSDCASIALNYYQGGMKFFSPETHNLTSDGGMSGKCCTSEIPVLYYAVASLYQVFGYHEFIYRILNTLLFFLGLFYLFRLAQYVLKDTFWALGLSILFFTSPVLVYYGNNFLTNSSSFAFSLVAWYYFIRFTEKSDQKWLYVSMLFFLIAAAFKLTAFFSLFAIIGIYLLEISGLVKFKESRKLFQHHIGFILPVVSIIAVIGSWIFYAHAYNQAHDSTYFSTTIFPLWALDSQQISDVFENIRMKWVDQYFHYSVVAFLGVCLGGNLIYFRKSSRILMTGVLIILAEIIAYIILQFYTFADHDYYTINMYILPVLIVLSTFDLLKRQFPSIFHSIISKVAFSLFLIFNVYYAQQKMVFRYEGWMNDFKDNKDLYSVTPYLRQMGISPNDPVISIPDGSNSSLYLMNQKGWTEYTDARYNKGEAIPYNQDSAGIQSSIDKGAKYLIINGIKELYGKEYLQNYCVNLVGNYNNVLIFDLIDSQRNFNLAQRSRDTMFTCNAEHITVDRQFFIGESDSTVFLAGSTQSAEYAHSGKHSSKTDPDSPYGMSIKFNELKNGESFVVTVWRKRSNKAKSGIIATGSPYPYYNNKYKVMETDSAGWEKLYKEFFVPAELTDQELTIYLYNPGSQPVYFDDLKIIRYESVLN